MRLLGASARGGGRGREGCVDRLLQRPFHLERAVHGSVWKTLGTGNVNSEKTNKHSKQQKKTALLSKNDLNGTTCVFWVNGALGLFFVPWPSPLLPEFETGSPGQTPPQPPPRPPQHFPVSLPGHPPPPPEAPSHHGLLAELLHQPVREQQASRPRYALTQGS